MLKKHKHQRRSLFNSTLNCIPTITCPPSATSPSRSCHGNCLCGMCAHMQELRGGSHYARNLCQENTEVNCRLRRVCTRRHDNCWLPSILKGLEYVLPPTLLIRTSVWSLSPPSSCQSPARARQRDTSAQTLQVKMVAMCSSVVACWFGPFCTQYAS